MQVERHVGAVGEHVDAGGTCRVRLPVQPRRRPPTGVARRPRRASPPVAWRRRRRPGRRRGAGPAGPRAGRDHVRPRRLSALRRRRLRPARQRRIRDVRGRRLAAVSSRLIVYERVSYTSPFYRPLHWWLRERSFPRLSPVITGMQGRFKGVYAPRAIPPVRGRPPSAPQMKFLVSVNGHLGLKFTDYMLVLCQNLHICTYN